MERLINNNIQTFDESVMEDEIKSLKKTIQDLTTELEEYRSIAEKVGAKKAVSDKEKWEKLADELYGFAEIIYHTNKNSKLNTYYAEIALQAINNYTQLKKENGIPKSSLS